MSATQSPAVPPASSKRQLIENLISNYGYIGFLALIPIFVVPLYLRLLGTTVWGSVAVCLTLQGFLFSLDMALSPLMLRDVARAAASAPAPRIYRRFLRIYATASAVVCVGGWILLQLIANSRATRGESIPADMVWALRLALVQFLFQFSNNAAVGYWNGLEQQRLANLRLAAFTLAKHALALFLLAAWSASASVYMGAFALVAAIEFVVNCRRVALEQTDASFDAPAQRRHDVLGYAAAALLGLGTAQIDRGYLSLALPSTEYGLYFLIGVPMLTFFSLQMPIQRAYLPRLATASSPNRVAAAMLKISFLLIVIPSLLLAAFPQLALSLWLRNPELAAHGSATFRLLMLTVAMNAVFAPAGLLLLNRHRNATIGALNLAILLAQSVLLLWLTPRLGMVAGAVAWLACGLIQLVSTPGIWRAFGRRDIDKSLTEV